MSIFFAIRLVKSVKLSISGHLSRAGKVARQLSALVGGLAVIPLALGLGLRAARQPAAPLPVVQTDTVFGPMDFVTATGAPQIYVEQFSVTLIPGRQYTISVTNGAADGTLRISSATITLNGESLFDQSTFNERVGFLAKHVPLQANNTLEVRVEGAPDGYLTIVIEREPDASFVVYGPERFIRAQGTPNPTTRTFTIAPDEPPPYVLHIANGDVDSTNRLSAATVTLNGTDVVTSSELNQQVGSIVKEVTLLATDTMVVTLQSQIGSFFTIWFTATDTTPPVLTITTPLPGAITRDSQIQVTGTVVDQTNTLVTVNGIAAPLTNGAFSVTVPLPSEGDNLITVSAVDAGRHQTDSTRTVIRDTQPPVVTVTAPTDGLITNQTGVTVSGSVTDITPVTVNANGVPLPVDGAGQFSGSVGLNEGINYITVVATDAVGNTAPQVVRIVTRDTQAPVIAIVGPADGSTVTTDTVRVTGTVTDATTVTLTVNGQPFTVQPDSTFSGVIPLVLGPNTLTTIATDAATNSATDVRTVTRLPSGPPDPSTVATPIMATEASLLQENTAFLYTGENPVQTGVAPGTIGLLQAAVLRGRVVDRTFAPLSGVAVTVSGHPEFGNTQSRQDGMFDLAVNGGGTLALNFQKAGYLPVQRHVDAPWQTFTLPDDVVLLQPDSVVTIVNLASNAIQVAQGSVQSDADGPRQATAFFEPGTVAVLVHADGSTDTLTSLAIRATEFTVGDSGAMMMPAELPPASQYTYAVQVTADEQLAAGPGSVIQFNQPVPLYVQNFLDIPVGTAVPVGSYDPVASAWDPERNGVVLKILGTDGTGHALLDINGDGVADSDSALSYYGIDPLETIELAGTFSAGTQLWRAEMLQTRGVDLNWGLRIIGGTPPTGEVKGPCGEPGADILRCQLQVQTAFQGVGITGSPFTLNYASDRAKGNAADRTLDIKLIGGTIPPYLLRVQLQIDVAGRRFRAVFLPDTNLSYRFTWDGVDAYGRTLQASQPAVVKIGYVYPAGYSTPAPGTESFGQSCAVPLSSCPLAADVQGTARAESAVFQTILTTVGGFDAQGMGLGGFTFDVQQAYDPVGKMLYAGDGTRRPAGSLPEQITRFAGNGTAGTPSSPILDGVPATQSILMGPYGVVVGPDGSVYISDQSRQRVRRVGPDGIITTVAGTGGTGYNGDGIPATSATLSTPRALALGADGSLYIVDYGNQRVRRVSPDGIITTFAGNGSYGWGGDGGPATAASFKGIGGVAVGRDGSVYIADAGNARVRRVAPDGIITTFAGTGGFGFSGDGGPARQAVLQPGALAIGPDGSVYFTQGAVYSFGPRVRQIRPDGIIRTIAGRDGALAPITDGMPALQATLPQPPLSLAVGPEGTVYLTWAGALTPPLYMVVRIRPDGLLYRVAGTGQWTGVPYGDGGAALQARVTQPQGIAVGPDGSVYFPDQYTVRRVKASLPGLLVGSTVIASADGSELYVFSPAGRILLTLNAATRDTMYTFLYDASRRLVAIRDVFGGITRVQRDSLGLPTAYVAPSGEISSLSEDGGRLTVTGPDSLTSTLLLGSDGLVQASVDPSGDTTHFRYDVGGQLTEILAPTGGIATRTVSDSGALVTTPSGQTLNFSQALLAAGGQQITANAGGLEADATINLDGSTTTRAPDGTTVTSRQHPHPAFGMEAPLQDITVVLPGGNTAAVRTNAAVVLDPNTDELVQEVDSALLNGRSRVTTFNFRTRLGSVVTPAGRQIAFQVDSTGRATEERIPGLAVTQWRYGVNGRIDSIAFGDQRWQFGYDSAGRVLNITDPTGSRRAFVYDVAGRPLADILGGRDTTRYAYDARGAISSIAPPGRPEHTFTYTPSGLLSSYQPPPVPNAAAPTAFAYDTDQRLTQVIRATGDTVTIQYDSAGRRSAVITREGSYGYRYADGTGRLQRVAVPSGDTVAFDYDGHLPTRITWTGPVAGAVAFEYNSDFEIASELVNDSSAVIFQYDADGLIAHAGSLTVSRDPQNGLLTGNAIGGVTTTVSYDSLGQLSGLVTRYGPDTVFSARYARDLLRRVISATETSAGQAVVNGYAYDPVTGELTGVTRNGIVAATYEYDANGNRVRVARSGSLELGVADAQDRLLEYGNISYGYSAAGEREYRAEGADTTWYTYDAFGDLLAVTLPDRTRIGYVLDGMHRRVGRRVNGALVQGFLYAGALPAAEVDSEGTIVSRFVFGVRQDSPDYMVRDGRTFALVRDQLGSVRLVVDVATGEVAQRLDFDEFGRVVEDTRPGFQPFGYAGGLYDPQTALVHFGARDYDPAVGRWITKDPTLFGANDGNLYRYVHNQPVSRTDRTGLCGDSCSLVGTAMATAALGTMLSNQLLGRPVFQSVFQNTALAFMAGYTATVVVPAMLTTATAWGFASGVAAAATKIVIGKYPINPQEYLGRAGYVILDIPPSVYNFLGGMTGRMLNWVWIRYWEMMGASFKILDPFTAGNIFNQEGGLTGFGYEIKWLFESGTLSSGRIIW